MLIADLWVLFAVLASFCAAFAWGLNGIFKANPIVIEKLKEQKKPSLTCQS